MYEYSSGLTKENCKDRLDSVNEMLASKNEALDAYSFDDRMVDRLCDHIHELKDMKEDILKFMEKNGVKA